jgi:hypothetical protein
MMGWDREFDFPVPGCRTFKDGASYIMKLPAKQQREQHWQLAGEILIKAAERNDGWTTLAHMAMLRAMNHGKPPPNPQARGKRAKTYRIVR